jgi:hypothetical protein
MKDDVLRKIKACLARANSTGAAENEAEIALRQARALMEKHGITESAVQAADVADKPAQISQNNPAAWVTMLGNLISNYFQVMSLWDIGAFKRKTAIRFMGNGPSVEIAAYAFDVLYRQLKRDRTAYLRSISKRVKKANKTTRADAYAEGWVMAVSSKVAQFVKGPSDETRTAVSAYLEHKGVKTVEHVPRSSDSRNGIRGVDDAKWSGYFDGKKADLNHGVGRSGSGAAALEKH